VLAGIHAGPGRARIRRAGLDAIGFLLDLRSTHTNWVRRARGSYKSRPRLLWQAGAAMPTSLESWPLPGSVACAIATAAWVCASTGRTPAWLFERLGVLRELRSAVTVWGVPIEFFGLTWFLGLVYLAIARHRWPPARRIAVTFFSAVLLTGASLATTWSVSFSNWTMNVVN